MTSSNFTSRVSCCDGVDSDSTTKSGPRRANDRPHGIGTEVQMHADPTERQPLKRLSPDEFGDSTYLHPHGYVIVREKRTWSERTGRMHGQADPPPPLYWWTVYFHIARRRPMLEGRPERFLAQVSQRPQNRPKEFDTLRDARAWCDENPREGWING